MSFTAYKDVVAYGDTVILYLGYDNMLQFQIVKGKMHQTKFGSIKHDELIGVKFGSKVACSRGYVYLLHPTPELWTVTLPHRTQIIYSTDISMITLQLDLRRGSVVIEAGTGSASLSHAIVRTVAPDGHLHTFDFHEQRVCLARDEFAAHGFADLVSVSHRDVCSEGFGVDNCSVDAVFLDLPSPWLAIPFASLALKSGGRVCTFSPCIEQVQRSCVAMRDNGFTEITTLECLNRPYDVRTVAMAMPDLGYGPGCYYSQGEIASVKPVIGRVELECHGQNHRCATDIKVEEEDNLSSGVDDVECVETNESNYGEREGKRQTKEDVERSNGVRERRARDGGKASYVCKSGMASINMNGHTGFLTFATLYP